MRIIALSGSPSSLPCLNYLLKSDFLTALICPIQSNGLEVVLLEDWAMENGLPCWQIEQNDLEKDLAELIQEIAPDLILVYAFPYKLPLNLLRRVKHGAWNVHFSLQQNNRGSVIIHKLAEGGVNEKVLQQCTVSLLPSEIGSPISQLSHISVALLQDAIRNIEQGTRNIE
jgi:methionyl-tRNA formyltransferase